MKPDAGGRRRRGLWFAVTPFLAVVLVAAVAVVVHNNRHNPAASRASFQHLTTTRRPPSTTTTPSPTPTTTTPPFTPTTPENQALIGQAIGAVDSLQFRGVTFGVAIEDRVSGQVTGGANGATSFYAASVIKLFTVTYLLHQQEIGALTLGQNMTDLIPRALEMSDDDAENAFWSTYGGASLIPKFVALFGLQNTIPPPDPAQWGETKFSAQDVLRVYDYTINKLGPTDAALVMGDLAQAADTGADGFDQAFGLLAPPRMQTVKAKQGWMEIIGESLTLNSTGALGADNDFLIAIMSRQPVGIGWTEGESHMNTAAAVVAKVLSPAIG